MIPSLAYPTKPFVINQNWNNPNPMYAHFGYKNHNGVDFIRWRDDKRYAVYCPADRFTVTAVYQNTDPKGALPNGGGNQIEILSDDTFEENGVKYRLYMYFLHAEYIFCKQGDKLQEGEMMMIADNTGFSTGTHTHWGCYRVHPTTNAKLDTNDASGSCNPLQWIHSRYAQEGISQALLMKNVGRYISYYFKK